MNESDTGKVVRYSYDPENPPGLNEEDKEQLAALDRMSDDDIDFSDIPKVTDFSGFRRVGNFPEVLKRRIAEAEARAELLQTEGVKLEADVLEFFKETGDASPDRINAVLREYVVSHRKSA